MNELQKLIDMGWEVRIFPNALGSISAVAKHVSTKRKVITDHFTLPELMQAIADKVMKTGMYAE